MPGENKTLRLLNQFAHFVVALGFEISKPEHKVHAKCPEFEVQVNERHARMSEDSSAPGAEYNNTKELLLYHRR